MSDPEKESVQPSAPRSTEVEPSRPFEDLRTFFEPLFANTGGIDSWLSEEIPTVVGERLEEIQADPLSHGQLCQLLIRSHEAGVSKGFFRYYWLDAPTHTYDVRIHGVSQEEGFSDAWLDTDRVGSLQQLRWGLYRFYVDALLYFGNVRSAFRSLRYKSYEELDTFFGQKRLDDQLLRMRGPGLPLKQISKDNRFYVAEYACKSLDAPPGQENELEQAAIKAYRAHLESGGDAVVSVADLLGGSLTSEYSGRQLQFQLSADDILNEVIASEDAIRASIRSVSSKFAETRAAALENTRLFLSMVEELDVYVATSMRTRQHFRNMGNFCERVFRDERLKELSLRYFDPTLSAAEGHVDKGIIECLMVDAASTLLYYAGDKETLGKDFEAAMALSRGKPVIFFCEDDERERMYRDVHPLTRLIEFDTGVAIGGMVTQSEETVAELLLRIFTNSMQYRIEKSALGSLLLREVLTDSIVRLQTHDPLLRETFWNYYHRRGVLA